MFDARDARMACALKRRLRNLTVIEGEISELPTRSLGKVIDFLGWDLMQMIRVWFSEVKFGSHDGRAR